MATVNNNYLFIYCEWLNDELTRRFFPDAAFITGGYSEGREVRFVSYKDDAGNDYAGGCCAVKVDDPKNKMYGVIWKVTAEELERLDKLVNVNGGRYTRLYQAVVGDDGKAYACVSHSIKNPTGMSKPSQEYIENMLKGAVAHKFPPAYIAKLEALR